MMKLTSTFEEFLTAFKAKTKKEQKGQKASEEGFDYNEVVKTLGRSCGLWQCRLLGLLAVLILLDGLYDNLYEFTAFTPSYRCNIPFCEHPGNATYFMKESSKDFALYVERGIPTDQLQTGEGCDYLGISGMPIGMDQEAILNKESCDFYLSETARNSSDLLLKGCAIEHLVFDTSLMRSSIVTSYRLACQQRKWIKSFVDVLHQMAGLFGLLAFGLLADRCGRQKAMLCGLCIASVSGIFTAFTRTVAGFTFFYVCLGLAKAGLFLPAFILLLEMSGKTLAMSLFPAKYFLGPIIASLLAYCIPIWTSLQLLSFGLGLVWLLPLVFFTHESPRWLLSKGKCDEARDVVKRAASINGLEIKVQILHPTESSRKSTPPAVKQEHDNQPTVPSQGQRPLLTKLWKDIVFNFEDKSASFFRSWMLNLALQWTIMGLALKGQLIKTDPDNPFKNVAFEALISLPGLTAALLLSGHSWGLRPLLTFCHICSSLMFVLQSLGLYVILPNMALFGHLTANMFLYCSLACLQLLTCLLAPTTQSRATFVGLHWAFFVFGRVGSHLLNLLVISAQWLPTTILAVLTAMAALVAFFLLPETSGLHCLPEKWEDINELKKVPRKSFLNFNLPKLHQLSIFA